MITLGKLQIEGFGGIAKEMTFNLHQPGLNILNSPNGSKKTTIFSALCWALYGKSLKPKSQIETWEDKRPKDFKGTLVSLYFGDGDEIFSIHRCLKYKGQIQGAPGSSRLIICRFKSEIPFKDKNQAQKWIVKKLGMSFELFKNTVVFGQKMKRFIEEDGPTKKAIFEEVFDTSYIQAAKDLAVEKREEYTTSLSTQKNNLESFNIRLDGLEQLRKANEKHIKDFEDLKGRDLRRERAYRKAIRKELSSIRGNYGADLHKNLERLQSATKKAEEAGKEAQQWDNLAFKLDLDIKQKEAIFEASKKEQGRLVKELAKKHFTCSLCNQKLAPEHQIKHTKQLRLFIKEETAKQDKLKPIILENKVKYKKQVDLADKLKNIAKGMDRYDEEIHDLKEIISKIEELERDKRESLKKITQIKDEKPNITDLNQTKLKIKHLLSKIGPLKALIEENQKTIEDYDWVIKDPLSNSGIKAFIFSQMIKKVNAKLINYSHIINGHIKFGIDLETGNRDFYITIEKAGNIRFYPDLSGGEQQLINICIAFAMFDTISESNPFNLLVCDEVFEGLDDSNVEIVGELIRQKAKGRSLFVITHKRTFIPTNSNLINIS